MFIDLRTSGWKTGQKVSWPTEFLEGCRGVLVGEWQDVAVDPQGGGGVAVPEPVLGLQDVPLGQLVTGGVPTLRMPCRDRLPHGAFVMVGDCLFA